MHRAVGRGHVYEQVSRTTNVLATRELRQVCVARFSQYRSQRRLRNVGKTAETDYKITNPILETDFRLTGRGWKRISGRFSFIILKGEKSEIRFRDIPAKSVEFFPGSVFSPGSVLLGF